VGNTNEDELCHIFLHCKALKEFRKEHLSEIINKLRKCKEVKTSGEVNQQDLKVTCYLMGGYCSASGPIVGSLNNMLRKMNAPQRFMFLWRHGYGNITGIQPENMALYGFVPVARFLKSAFGLYQKSIDSLYKTTPIANALVDM
jgi:hypothetical protein